MPTNWEETFNYKLYSTINFNFYHEKVQCFYVNRNGIFIFYCL